MPPPAANRFITAMTIQKWTKATGLPESASVSVTVTSRNECKEIMGHTQPPDMTAIPIATGISNGRGPRFICLEPNDKRTQAGASASGFC